jgi:hypothetical protein
MAHTRAKAYLSGIRGSSVMSSSSKGRVKSSLEDQVYQSSFRKDGATAG